MIYSYRAFVSELVKARHTNPKRTIDSALKSLFQLRGQDADSYSEYYRKAQDDYIQQHQRAKG